jgi:hypothetical protein
MRRVLATIGATLVIVVLFATSAGPASAGGGSMVTPANDPFFVDIGSW